MLRSFIRVNRLGGAQKFVGSNRVVLSTEVNNSFSLHSARNQFSTSTSSPNTSSPYASIKSIGIIGGGVAGLQTAKILAARGFEVTIFESSPEVGGVWRKNYSGFGVQVPKELYEFHDFPFSAAAPGEFVAGPKVQKYILDYVHDAKLQDVIRTNTLVSKVEEDTTGLEGKQKGWKFHIKDATNGTTSTESFDFAVCATGMYSTKHFPEIKNISNFMGDYIHSTDFVDASIAKGKNVLVLGSAKSAIDCVLEAKKAGASQSILLARNAHWGTPRNIAGLIPFKYVFLSRFGQALVSWYKGAWPTAPSSVKVTHSALAVVMGPVFKIVEALFAFQLGLYGKMAPSSNTDVVKDFYGYAHVLDSSFKNALSSGSILVEKGSVGSVSDDGKGVVTTDGKVIPADVIVAGTGTCLNSIETRQ
jgi:dimethylaniline monooxygenase (N-oxide forming)